MERGRPVFSPDFTCPLILWILPGSLCFAYVSLTLSGWLSHTIRLALQVPYAVLNPYPYHYGRFGLFRFRSPLLTESLRFLFLRVLRCFTSPGSLLAPMNSVQDLRFFTVGVAPFGDPWINAYLQLPTAYRSLSRPSSAPDAKAFTLCSFSLEFLPSISLSVYVSGSHFFELLEFLLNKYLFGLFRILYI